MQKYYLLIMDNKYLFINDENILDTLKSVYLEINGNSDSEIIMKICQDGNHELLNVLINFYNNHEKADVFDVDDTNNIRSTYPINFNIFFYNACKTKNFEMIGYMLDNYNILEPLTTICALGYVDVFEFYLSEYYENIVDVYGGCLAFHIACIYENMELAKHIHKNFPEINHDNMFQQSSHYNKYTTFEILCVYGIIDFIHFFVDKIFRNYEVYKYEFVLRGVLDVLTSKQCYNELEVIKTILIYTSSNTFDTYIKKYCEIGNLKIVQYLIERVYTYNTNDKEDLEMINSYLNSARTYEIMKYFIDNFKNLLKYILDNDNDRVLKFLKVFAYACYNGDLKMAIYMKQIYPAILHKCIKLDCVDDPAILEWINADCPLIVGSTKSARKICY